MKKTPQLTPRDSEQAALRIGSMDDGAEVDRVLVVLAVENYSMCFRCASPTEETNCLLLFFNGRPASFRHRPSLADRLESAAIVLAGIDREAIDEVTSWGLGIDLVLCAAADRWEDPPERLIAECKRLGLEVWYMDPRVEAHGGRVSLNTKCLNWPPDESVTNE